MSFLSYIFGTGADTYSSEERLLSEKEIRQKMSEHVSSTLEHHEIHVIEEALIERRHGDGKISLRQIYEVLKKLEGKRLISQNDRRAVMKMWTEYFKKQ